MGYVVLKTDEFDGWLRGLRDPRARDRILVRIRPLELGNPGHVASVGEGLSEMKIDYGPGYRVYYRQVGREICLVLWGGDKGSQSGDIKVAKSLAARER